ncbi:MAG: hypothetical protein DRQ55_05780 [Planctomycetota bacterium]|nr:MAG: hypothetical protein DRQ55_05780 [Planctomycetota bacterium]
MRTPIATSILLCGLAVTLLPGCSDPATADQLSRVRAELDDSARELGELGTELGDLAKLGAQRLATAVGEQMDQLDGRLAGLKQDAAKLSGQTKQSLDQALVEVEAKREVLAGKLAELKRQGADAAIELRQGVAAAYDELALAVTEARAAMHSEAPAAAEALEQPLPDQG